jgi:hypothetical protein
MGAPALQFERSGWWDAQVGCACVDRLYLEIFRDMRRATNAHISLELEKARQNMAAFKSGVAYETWSKYKDDLIEKQKLMEDWEDFLEDLPTCRDDTVRSGSAHALAHLPEFFPHQKYSYEGRATSQRG